MAALVRLGMGRSPHTAGGSQPSGQASKHSAALQSFSVHHSAFAHELYSMRCRPHTNSTRCCDAVEQAAHRACKRSCTDWQTSYKECRNSPKMPKEQSELPQLRLPRAALQASLCCPQSERWQAELQYSTWLRGVEGGGQICGRVGGWVGACMRAAADLAPMQPPALKNTKNVMYSQPHCPIPALACSQRSGAACAGAGRQPSRRQRSAARQEQAAAAAPGWQRTARQCRPAWLAS